MLRHAAATLGLVASLTACTSHQAAHGTEVNPRPNILLVMTDDQTYDSLSAMPNVQALAARGTSYIDYHANFPLCCPSRTTTMTGQYAHSHGVWGNGGNEGGGWPAFQPTAGNSLPVWLHDAGYKTMMVGKFLNEYDASYGVPPGWDRWRVWNHSDESNSRYTDVPVVYEDGTVHPTTGYSTTQWRKQAKGLIDESATGQPWFMWLAFNAPHTSKDVDPDDPPSIPTASPAPQDLDTFEGTTAPTFGTPVFNEADVTDKPRHVSTLTPMSANTIAAVNEAYSQQLEALQAVDRAVADIQNELATTGQLDNTVIAFTTDNGYYYGEHRIRSGKRTPYSPSSHLPLIVAGPGFNGGGVSPNPRLNADLAPTFVDLAGATAGRTMDGVSLLDPVNDTRPLLIEGRVPDLGIAQFSALRRPNWFYARYQYVDGSLAVELYDLTADPTMLTNVAGQPAYASREQKLRTALEEMAGYRVKRTRGS